MHHYKLKFRKLASVMIIGALLCTVLPAIIPEDANLDNKIDLKDAIIFARHFSATGPDSGTTVCKAASQTYFNALCVIAGLKNAPQASNNSDKISFSDLIYLVETPDIITRLPDCGYAVDAAWCFTSVFHPSLFRPPTSIA